ncbi:MAG: arginase family protein [Gammaproteobacteria bacterium]|nr:arginase family protein [Gammaproteobacteria bacterium]
MRDKPDMQSLFGGCQMNGFADFPVRSVDRVEGADVAVVGVPVATSYATVGAYCAGAPEAIRRAFGWSGVLHHHDFDLEGTLLGETGCAVDCGNLACSESDFGYNRALIRDAMHRVLKNQAVPVVLGGDDSVPIPVLQAYEDFGPITILQLDAHIDWRDEVHNERFGLSSNMRRASEMSWVEGIIQVGARGLGSARPGDVRDALDWGVEFFPMHQVSEQGLEAVVGAVPAGARVYIALDIDVMDPSVVPAVIGPAPGGFAYWDVVALFRKVARKARIVGFNLVELMPDADIGGRGTLVAARIAATVSGLIARQRQP